MNDAGQDRAAEALQALPHGTRLSVFRMLVQASEGRLMAGVIAQRPLTMSHHLARLERAGLVQSERDSRIIRYRADYADMRRLLAFLLEDCCQGDPQLCADLTSIPAYSS